MVQSKVDITNEQMYRFSTEVISEHKNTHLEYSEIDQGEWWIQNWNSIKR